jgi:hypothetical protein
MEFILNGDRFDLDPDDVIAAVRGVPPDRIYDHAVEVEGRLYPVKQVFGLATRRDHGEFTSQRARDVLRRLGFRDPRRRAPEPEPALPSFVVHPEPATQPSVWVLELRTATGATHEFEIADEADVPPIREQVAEHVGTPRLFEFTARHPAADGGTAQYTVAWQHVTSAALYRRPSRIGSRD